MFYKFVNFLVSVQIENRASVIPKISKKNYFRKLSISLNILIYHNYILYSCNYSKNDRHFSCSKLQTIRGSLTLTDRSNESYICATYHLSISLLILFYLKSHNYIISGLMDGEEFQSSFRSVMTALNIIFEEENSWSF